MIKWLSDRVGAAPYGSLTRRDFARYGILDVRVLVDGPGNCSEDLQQAIDDGVRILSHAKRLVVACDMGVSRSRAVALGVLVALGLPFESALASTSDESGQVSIDAGLLQSVAALLGKETTPHVGASILLLAAEDFIGLALSRALESIASVDYVQNAAEYILTSPSELLFSQRVRNSSCIVFMLTPTSRHSSWAIAEHLHRVKNTLEVAKYTSKRVIYLSSISLFGGYSRTDADTAFVSPEDLQPSPFGTYAETQYLAEELINIYSRNHDVSTSIIRASQVYGTGMESHAFLRKMANFAIQGRPLVTHAFKNGLPQLELLHVDDFAAAVKSIVLSPHATGIFHAGTGYTHTTADIAALLAERTGARSPRGIRNVEGVVRNVVSAQPASLASLGWLAKTSLVQGLDALIREQEDRRAVCGL